MQCAVSGPGPGPAVQRNACLALLHQDGLQLDLARAGPAQGLPCGSARRGEAGEFGRRGGAGRAALGGAGHNCYRENLSDFSQEAETGRNSGNLAKREEGGMGRARTCLPK